MGSSNQDSSTFFHPKTKTVEYRATGRPRRRRWWQSIANCAAHRLRSSNHYSTIGRPRYIVPGLGRPCYIVPGLGRPQDNFPTIRHPNRGFFFSTECSCLASAGLGFCTKKICNIFDLLSYILQNETCKTATKSVPTYSGRWAKEIWTKLRCENHM